MLRDAHFSGYAVNQATMSLSVYRLELVGSVISLHPWKDAQVNHILNTTHFSIVLHLDMFGPGLMSSSAEILLSNL
jgi:hypothetical protein